MIYIGLTGWRDHPTLHTRGMGKTLQAYSSYFPVVEVDAAFYAIQNQRNYEKWMTETPDMFRFVVKAFQGMTGHTRGESNYTSLGEMFSTYLDSIQPLVDQGRLSAVLFQYPPWFDCRKENIEILRYTKKKMAELPCALEFRHQSWFYGEMKERTLTFMEQEGWIHTICDEPQAGSGSVPTILYPTHPDKTLIRFHGRNVYAWNNNGQADWREKRYLYRYSEAELTEWVANIRYLHSKSKEVIILFNNNSGGDAADNAQQLMQLLGIEYSGLHPRQLELF